MIRPAIRQRACSQKVYDQLIDEGFDKLQARIMSGRIHKHDAAAKLAQPRLKYLDSPWELKNITKASARIIDAIKNNQMIGIETDHDCDGQTAHAVLYESLTQICGHPPANIRSYIGHRLKEGYGLSEALLNRIVNDEILPDLIITADNGSTDEPRIEKLKQKGIDVIVTDHHALPPEGIPQSAYAVLNPSRPDCSYSDNAIAGCMVAWLLMTTVHHQLVKQNDITEQKNALHDLLDFVAIGTISDCVSMATSINNRAVTLYGMKKIERLTRHCWMPFKSALDHGISSDILGFQIGPLLNSDGRLSDAFTSVNFLLANSAKESKKWANHLTHRNNERKNIQKALTDQAIKKAYQKYYEGFQTLSIFLEEGNAGVHGITASRIKDGFGRVTTIFSRKENEPGILSGSARSVDPVHLKEILDQINEYQPGLLLKYGGHQKAAGLTIQEAYFEQFCHIMEMMVTKQHASIHFQPCIMTDGKLDPSMLDFKTLKLIRSLEPYGRGFEFPVFEGEALIHSQKRIGKKHQHLQFVFDFEGRLIKGIWFNASYYTHSDHLQKDDHIYLVFQLNHNVFKGQSSLNLMIHYAEKIENFNS